MAWSEFDTLFGGSPRRIPWHETGMDPRLPLLDVGSGSGAGVVDLAQVFPDSSVEAVEPDASMRALLMHRVVTAGLADRVTVWPVQLADVPVAGPFGGIVATGVLYFLSPDERRAAWDWFAAHLAPGCPVVVEDGEAPDPSDPELERLLVTRRLGRLRYERWFSQRPCPDGSVSFTNTIRTWSGDDLVAEDASTWRSWPLDRDRRKVECLASGAFDVVPLDDRHWIARRR